MERLSIILLLVICVFQIQANGVSFPIVDNLFLMIDCGVIGEFTLLYNDRTWYPDSKFIDSGKTHQIINSTAAGVDDLPQFTTTLRYFPKHDLNCYGLALTNHDKYLFRAGFYYANYDGKSEPPVFDLLLGGDLWETVNTSASINGRPIFHELMYTPKTGNVSVCLRAKKDGGVPFISSLEATYLGPFLQICNTTAYSKVKNGTAYHLLSRINFGGYDQLVMPWSGEHEERLNRYWMPQQMPGYLNVSFEETIYNGECYENSPPRDVINTAISAPQNDESIYVPISFPSSNPESAYIVLYFYQNLNASETNVTMRCMDIYVDGLLRENVKLEQYRWGEVVTLYPLLVQDVANLTISPANGTLLPPFLNAMEVFIATQLDEQPNYGHTISSSIMLLSIFLFFLTVFLVLD